MNNLDLNTLGILKIWKKLQSLNVNIDVRSINTALTAIYDKVNQLPMSVTPITDLSTVNAKLDAIQSKVNTLATANAGTIIYEKLTLNPSYQQTGISIGNLSKIFDGDVNTSCDQFVVTGAAWLSGELIINPNVTIPSITKIFCKIGFASSNPPNIPGIEIDVNKGGVWIPVWAKFGETVSASSPDNNIHTFEIIVPYSYNQIRVKAWDLGRYGTVCKIYEIEIYEVKVG